MQLQSMRSCLASDFVVLVLSEAVLSETAHNLIGIEENVTVQGSWTFFHPQLLRETQNA